MAQPFSSSSCVPRRPPPSAFSPPPRKSASHVAVYGPRRRAVTATASLHLGPGEIAELARNKVLIAAMAASAIGQLSKPFTSGTKWGAGGAGFDAKTAFRSGGMPSTHSASVVAVATSLGLERGLADSVFGMSLVFAAIVMYDAQGVRREVGKHARVLNKFWVPREKVPQDSEVDMAPEFVSVTEEAISLPRSNASPSPRRSSWTESPRLNGLGSSEPKITEVTELNSSDIEKGYLLRESVGHTELQVTAGALLGFIVSLAVYATL